MSRFVARRAIFAAIAIGLFLAGWVIGGEMGAPRWLYRVLGSRLPDEPLPAEAQLAPTGPAAPGEARIVFVGDVLPLEDRDYFAAVHPLIAAADLAVANLECPLSTHGRRASLKLDGNGRALPNEYLFIGPPKQARALAEAGFDAVTLANNHTMDYGGEALLETLAVLDEAGLRHAGAGPDERSARAPAILEAAGQTVAVLAYVSDRTLPGTDGFAATERTAGTVFVSGSHGQPTRHTRQMLRNDIRDARQRADFVVASFHWGTETQPQPDALPRALARYAIDCGADLVVGHHPHVLQGIELYGGRPIVYSLGNFVFRAPWPGNRLSAAMQLRTRGGSWREIVLHPVTIDARGVPRAASESDLPEIIGRIRRLSEQLGTDCEVLQSPPRVVVRNPAPPQRHELLVSERRQFTIEPHPEIDGMATVNFLAWELSDGEKHPAPRSVVVARELADEVLAIFREIYLDPERFPIAEVIGYDHRTVTGGSGLSRHALGRAIDINRAQNPMIRGGEKLVHPDEPPYEPGEWRPGEDPHSITPGGSVVRAFKRRGWRWGGDWRVSKDYQHFDRPG